jgi:predicted small metal-binding protein
MTVKRKQFVCLEAGCETAIEANSDEELVRAVQHHVAEAHNSFELEEFILAGATEVDVKNER